MTIASTDGLRLCVDDLGGTGTEVLLVHGAGFLGAVLEPLARTIKPIHCFTVDLRGHGVSASPPQLDFSWSDFAGDVLAARGVLGREAVGIGHSLGASALLLAEAIRPGSFRHLYCYEPIIDVPGGNLAELAMEMAERARRRKATFSSRQDAAERFRKGPLGTFDPDVFDAYLRSGLVVKDGGQVALACTPENEARTYEAGAASDLFNRLSLVTCPVTLAYGALDAGAVGEAMRAAARELSRANIISLEGLSHFGPLEDPTKVGASIIRAIERPPA